jgi:hypothetical protein
MTDMSGFNAIDTAQRLVDKGFARDQADTLAKLLGDLWGSAVTREVLREELSTVRVWGHEELDHQTREVDAKLTLVEHNLDGKITLLGHNLDGRLTLLEQNIGGRLAILGQTMTVMEQRLLLRLGGVIVVAMGAFSTIAHYWR